MTAENDEDARHKAKMANRKAVQDAEVAGKTIEKGLLIVHTGKGKGKSTAAFGLLLRAIGRSRRPKAAVDLPLPLPVWTMSSPFSIVFSATSASCTALRFAILALWRASSLDSVVMEANSSNKLFQ